MMTDHPFDDETLMAFADGELDQATAAEIARAAEADAAVAARIAAFRETREIARDALQDDASVSADLRASVQRMVDEATVPVTQTVPYRKAGVMQPRATRWALPLAASIALAIGGAGGYFAGFQSSGDGNAFDTAGLSVPGLSTALNTVPAGQETPLGEDRFRAIATFRDADESLCREFELDKTDGRSIVAVACRPGAVWDVQFTVVAQRADNGYAPASSLDVLDAFLTARGAGEPLPVDAEAAALGALAR